MNIENMKKMYDWFCTDYDKDDKEERKKNYYNHCVRLQRTYRNELLSKTDKFLLPDYPITEEVKTEVIEYRQYLRDFPQNEDFPFIQIEEKTF